MWPQLLQGKIPSWQNSLLFSAVGEIFPGSAASAAGRPSAFPRKNSNPFSQFPPSRPLGNDNCISNLHVFFPCIENSVPMITLGLSSNV